MTQGLALLLFLLLGNITWLQAFRADSYNADARNRRTQLARFAYPRGDILTFDGTSVARSVHTDDSLYAYRRTYPDGERYAPITGYVSLFGSTGLERIESAVLSGDDPRVRVNSLVRSGGIRGADVRLTVDSRAQRAAYDALRETGHRGAAVAINPATGAILALASYPSYDPNGYAVFDSAKLAAVDRRLREEPGQPLLNRATSETYPPGSTFKIVTTAAALLSGRYTQDTRVEAPRSLPLPGSSIRLPNAGGHACGDGRPPFVKAFQLSCNTAFAGIGLKLGADRLRDQAESFGFNDTTLSVPLPVAKSVFPDELDRPETAMAAIGQFDDRATPLLVAMFAAAVANHGVLMRPYLVEEVRLADRVIEQAEPSEYLRTLEAEVAREITAMMVTVTQPGGTGTAAAIPGVSVAAKTGTAENIPGAPSHAVFTGFAPAGAPEVAVGVVVEHAGSGGDVAAPVARAILRSVLG